jgi:hypothetical protein
VSATVPFVALAALIALSLSAGQAARIATSGGRQFAAAVLTFGVLMSLLMFS